MAIDKHDTAASEPIVFQEVANDHRPKRMANQNQSVFGATPSRPGFKTRNERSQLCGNASSRAWTWSGVAVAQTGSIVGDGGCVRCDSTPALRSIPGLQFGDNYRLFNLTGPCGRFSCQIEAAAFARDHTSFVDPTGPGFREGGERGSDNRTSGRM